MTQHFISGLPRSGSTLLAAILRQNPKITASMTSPAGAIFNSVHRAISDINEAATFLEDRHRHRLLRDAIQNCHDPNEIMFDTNRTWPSKLPTLVELFPECRIVCCVREIGWIIDSIERLVRKSPLVLSGLYGYDPNKSVFDRAKAYVSPQGVVGIATHALRDGYCGEHADRMLLIEYDTLAQFPQDTIRLLYDWLELPAFAHDFDNIEQIPGAERFDTKTGTKGLHTLMAKVQLNKRETILPPEVFKSFGSPFWRTQPGKAKIIR